MLNLGMSISAAMPYSGITIVVIPGHDRKIQGMSVDDMYDVLGWVGSYEMIFDDNNLSRIPLFQESYP